MGVRVKLKLVHQPDVEALFEQAGLAPIYKELRSDGVVSCWFAQEQVTALADSGVLERIPLHWWAGYMIAGGVSPIR